MPDVFIPVDTTRYTDYHRSIVATGLVNRIAMNYIDKHRAELNKKYPKLIQFKQNFNVTEEMTTPNLNAHICKISAYLCHMHICAKKEVGYIHSQPQEINTYRLLGNSATESVCAAVCDCILINIVEVDGYIATLLCHNDCA